MHVVIAGGGVVGLRIAQELMNGHDVVYVAPEGEDGGRTDRLDVRALKGSATSPEVLRRAQIDRADLFVACAESDETNIVSCLAAQRLGARRTVCMLNGAGFFRTDEVDSALAESLGIDAVVRPGEELAEEILRIVTVPSALDVVEFAGGRVRLLRFPVEPDAPATRKPIRDLSLPKQVQLVTVRRGDTIFVPSGDTRLEAGDKVIAMGRWKAIRALLFQHLRGPGHGTDKRVATVVGGGTVGFAIVRGLEEAGWRVKVIETNRERCDVIAGRSKSLVLHGDGCDIDLLQQERIAEAPVLVAVTDNDEKNLLVSLLAKQLGVERTVTRASRLSNEVLFERVGVDVVRSASGAAIRAVVRSVDHAHAEIQAELEHGDTCVIQLELPAAYRVAKLSDMRPPSLARVGSILRGRQLIVPGGNDELRPGDQLLIFCMRADEERTRDYFLAPDAKTGARAK